MSVIIKYNNETLCTAEAGQTVTLNTASRMLMSNLEILVDTDGSGSDTSSITFTVNNITYSAHAGEDWYTWITRLGGAESYETTNGTFSCAGENSTVYFNDLVLNCQETASIVDEGSDPIGNGYHYYTESEVVDPEEPEEPSEPSTDDISFWVDGVNYTAAQGTYWSEFVEQNSSTFRTDAEGVLYNGNPVYCSSNRARVTPEDLIHFEEYYANWYVFTINGIAFTFEGARPFYVITSSAPTMPIASRLTIGSTDANGNAFVYFDGSKVAYTNTPSEDDYPYSHTTVTPDAAFFAGAAASSGQYSFTVDDESYQGLYGMPWYDWCRSTYNTTASDVGSRAFCYNENSQVIFGLNPSGSDTNVLHLDGTSLTVVNSGDAISDSTTYITVN